ncbi:MAG: helix-turn-helix domain-containing protein [Lachnospiraceae bacterium]|nr:helix-turn-helix domain-containing protein [Lachnospiraceae bacterium]
MFEHYKDVMDVYDVAEALCIGKNRVYELLGNGSLKGFRIGRVWKIPRTAVQEYILTQSNLRQE